MVDPYKITNYKRSTEELEELLLFCIAVAGKTAYLMSKYIDEFLSERNDLSPFKYLISLSDEDLFNKIKKSSLGKHNLLFKSFRAISDSNLDLKKCSCQDLEKIPGIGFKTSRFFILHSRKNYKNIAVIDTHIKKWLNEKGHYGNYYFLEEKFIEEAVKANKKIAKLDLEIWNKYAKRQK